jgi:hypothetical protein
MWHKMTPEKYDKINKLVRELHDELKPGTGGPICEFISLDDIDREGAWWLAYLALSNLIEMEL